jgi:hypothetical protein
MDLLPMDFQMNLITAGRVHFLQNESTAPCLQEYLPV